MAMDRHSDLGAIPCEWINNTHASTEFGLPLEGKHDGTLGDEVPTILIVFSRRMWHTCMIVSLRVDL
jgi:hypothetical protein